METGRYSGLTLEEKLIEKRVDSVLNLMTLTEKIGQMNQYSTWGEPTGPGAEESLRMEDLKAGKIGSFINLTGAENTRIVQEIAMNETRLGIPLIFGLDVIHGYRTIFPVPLGEAASWDLERIEKSARIAAIEAAASGIHWTFAPMVDICRDPRWGRIMEGAGEDPFLGSLVAEARVKGFQGENLEDPNTIAACAKHYAAYGAAEGGRDYNTVDISERTLHEIYLKPFKKAAEAGVRTFMNSFNEIGGIPATGHPELVPEILKKDWGFRGFVVSDWNSIGEMIPHGYARDMAHAAELAITSGTDMDMQAGCYTRELDTLVMNGIIDEKLIDEAVRRILRIKFQLGLFDDPFKYCDPDREKEMILHPDHIEHARDIARRSIVLLKNDNGLLPISKDKKTIAVIGPLADDQDAILGEWRAKGLSEDAITLKRGIIQAIGENGTILYAKGCEIDDDSDEGFAGAVNAARLADVVIVALGESALMSGEALSRGNIGLPGNQEELLKAIHRTGKPVILVLMNGRPLTIQWASENIPSIIEAWLPGIRAGNAIADVIFGDYNPSGKLPVSFPYVMGQIPVYYNHKNTGRPMQPEQRYTSKYLDIPNEPLYPFGYGLSYTTFEYSELKLSSEIMGMEDELSVSVIVKNTGDRAGEEVVQMYVRDMVGSVTRPVLELKGFSKILLEPGQEKEVEFKLTAADLAFYGADMQFKPEPGTFKVFVGTNSVDLSEAEFALKE
ncbi:MAG: beta-glucosidase [Bacteroides sp. SM23_62_1]|nr:MAG: beta-glucosidase [Bacteroides sp. SM23_62_1]